MEEFPQKYKEPSSENINEAIKRLLENLDGYSELYGELSPELQEEWYCVEIEARVAKDREAAKKHLEEFLKTLQAEKDKK